jgi:hypothetical protein
VFVDWSPQELLSAAATLDRLSDAVSQFSFPADVPADAPAVLTAH